METLAAIIFVVMYMVIVSEKIHRTVAAMIGAVLMMLLGILSQEVALHHVDFETLGLLVGMMVLVGVTKETGLFDYVAIRAAKSAKAEPRRILVYLCVITAVFSAFLDNVTTVLLMVPVTFSITNILKLDPMPTDADHCVEHRRYGNAHRRSAEHHDRQCGQGTDLRHVH